MPATTRLGDVMKVLVVGAGAIGAYFGARLLEAGVDATFLVRPKRESQLRQGLSVRSPKGDIRQGPPPTVTAERLQKGFGVVLLSCKAYDLAGATCLMRGAIGDIVRSGGVDLMRRMTRECAAIAGAQGFAPRPQALGRVEAILTDADSALAASMLRDLERGARTEADHIIG